MSELTFNEALHLYTLDGAEIPSVTRIIGEAVGHIIMATEWHMKRGQIHHACYAMIAKGQAFKHDEYSQPWIDGCRKFFAEVKPEIIAAERQVYSVVNQYAGTLDLICNIGRKLTIIDFKNTACGTDVIQCAGYAIAHEEMTKGKEKVKQVLTVAINGDGGYHMGQIVDGATLRKARKEFLACRAIYAIKQREGMLTK